MTPNLAAMAAKRVGFFGPFGTFTQQALLTQQDLADAEHVAYRTVPDVLDAVEQGEVDLGVVPIDLSELLNPVVAAPVSAKRSARAT